jgi:histone demethylase JARID1
MSSMPPTAKRPSSVLAPPVMAKTLGQSTTNANGEQRMKRQRRIPERFDQQQGNISAAEQRALKQALENSQALQKHEFVDVPMAPIFYPTTEEFANPLKYIASIRDRASKSGIAKIVPPKGWNPPSCLSQAFQGEQNKTFATKKQYIHKLQEGASYGEGKRYTIQEFQKMATDMRAEKVARMIAKGHCSYRKREMTTVKATKLAPTSALSSSTMSVDVDNVNSGYKNDGTNDEMLSGTSPSSVVDGGVENGDLHSSASSSSSSSTPTTSVAPATYTAATSSTSTESMSPTDDNTTTTNMNDTTLNTNSSTDIDRGEPYVSMLDFEKEYWRIVETASEQVEVEYGSDLDAMQYGTGWSMNRPVGGPVKFECADVPCDFNNDEYYAKCGWNLNNLPHWPGSVLRHMKGNYNGINVPWMYVGMLYGTFAWHNEDNYLYSVSYNHSGAPKIWYGASGDQAAKLESCMRSFLMDRFREVPDLIYHLVTMIGPSILKSKNIDIVKAVQEPGHFMVTFPQAFHGGFSTGFNVGEAVNFAAPDWLTFGQLCSERYRTWARGSPISRERLVMAMVSNLNELDSLGCQLLWDQIKIMRDEQEQLRRQVYQAGVLHAMQMPHEKPDDEEFDEKRMCSTCQHLCFFSAVVCSCDPDKVACLRHHDVLCKCNRRENCFLFWYTVKEMDDALNGIANHIKTLKMNTVDLTK